MTYTHTHTHILIYVYINVLFGFFSIYSTWTDSSVTKKEKLVAGFLYNWIDKSAISLDDAQFVLFFQSCNNKFPPRSLTSTFTVNSRSGWINHSLTHSLALSYGSGHGA